MQTIQINDGDRIRLVVLNVNTFEGDSTNVTLRYNWTDAEPAHSCVADVCPFCTSQAIKIAARRFVPQGGDPREMVKAINSGGSVELLRDGQSTARPRTARRS